MKTVLIFFIFMSFNASGAELTGKDFPYWIFNDRGTTTYCFEPETIGQATTPCWAHGIKTDCKILPKWEGYIDCDVKKKAI